MFKSLRSPAHLLLFLKKLLRGLYWLCPQWSAGPAVGAPYAPAVGGHIPGVRVDISKQGKWVWERPADPPQAGHDRVPHGVSCCSPSSPSILSECVLSQSSGAGKVPVIPVMSQCDNSSDSHRLTYSLGFCLRNNL